MRGVGEEDVSVLSSLKVQFNSNRLMIGTWQIEKWGEWAIQG